MKQRRDEVLNEARPPLIGGKRARLAAATTQYEHVSIAAIEQGGRPTDITVTFNNEALPETAAGSPAFIQAIYSTRARGIF